MIGYEQKMARLLDVMGGLYTLPDVLTAIGEGKMQSHVVNNSWAITEIGDFPRVRKLNVLGVVGDLDDIDELNAKVLDYANDVNAGLVSTYGRRGWASTGARLGWRLKARGYLYHKDM